MSAIAQTHGLDGKLVAPDWPPLTKQEVARVLQQYAAPSSNVRLLSVSPRPFSAASVVEAGNQRVFVKRHARAVRNAEALREEHAFMAHLRTHGASVPRVLDTQDGATAVELGEWTYEVHELPSGIDLYQDAISWTPFFHASHAFSAGHVLAKLHQASAGYNAAPRTNRPLVAGFSIFAAADSGKSLAIWLETRPELADYLHQQGQWLGMSMALLHPFHAELLPLLPALQPLWTHNDLHPSNLFWSGAGKQASVTSIIDFGLSDRTNAVHDLANAIERSIVEWITLTQHPDKPDQVAIHFDHLAALLEGYESIRPLTPQELAALAPMTALCHAEFALSEADYFLTVLRSEEKTRIAVHDYLLGHAIWWRGAGEKLLDGIRAWAGKKSQ